MSNTTQHPCIECGIEPAMDDSAWCQGCFVSREMRLTELNQYRVPRCPKCMCCLPSWAAPCGICAQRRKPINGRRAPANRSRK